MFSDVKTLPDDPALLKGLIASLTSELTSRDVLIAGSVPARGVTSVGSAG